MQNDGLINMEFRCFKGPEADMADLLEGEKTCSICNQRGRCFDLGSSICSPWKEEAREGKYGCYQCLHDGRFGFPHDTEVGFFLDESGLRSWNSPTEERRIFTVAPSGEVVGEDQFQSKTNQKLIRDGAVEELRNTPNIITWNEISWPVCCRDFMVYLGNWAPKDFTEHAPDRDGKRLFLEIIETEYHRIWPSDIQKEWSICCYVFQCLHCKSLRGIVEHT